MIEQVASLIRAVASVLWPIFGLVALLLFRKELSNIVSRFRRGKLFGQEIELEASLEKLNQAAISVEREAAAIQSQTDTFSQDDLEESRRLVKTILQQAASSPSAALLHLSNEIERQARRLMADLGLLKNRQHVPLIQAIKELDTYFGSLPKTVAAALKIFWSTRNEIVHGGTASAEDTLRAIDSGLSILKVLSALHHPGRIVVEPAIAIYRDENCADRIEDAHAVILEVLTHAETKRNRQIFPTTRTHFKKGMRVAWEWSEARVWTDAWYKEPETGRILKAWRGSMEFVGRDLDAV